MTDAVKKLALQDPTLTVEERSALELAFKDDTFFDRLMQGAMGASVAYSIAKFLRLSRTSQIILTAAGFGIGRLIATTLHKQKKHDNVTTIPL